MTLTLNLAPEILDRLTRDAAASGISLEEYAVEVLTGSASELDLSPSKGSPEGLRPFAQRLDQRTVGHRQAWIQQRCEERNQTPTSGPALSQTIIESRAGERY
jgi:hypothetical protein